MAVNDKFRRTTARGDALAALTRRYEGKVAVCVACSYGIGFAMARRLAQEGAHVVIISRKQAEVNHAVEHLTGEGLRASGFVCDVIDDEARRVFAEKMSKEHGRVDALILNQGTFAGGGSLMEATPQNWAKGVQTNLESRWLQIRELKPLMRRGSSIVFTNGTGAYLPGINNNGIFYVTETALLGMTVLLAKELGPEGIRVNAVAPGPVYAKKSFFDGSWFGGAEKETEQNIWLQRIGEPDDIAAAVAFICSDDASWYTGHTMVVDGGGYSKL